jgi:rubredoxin
MSPLRDILPYLFNCRLHMEQSPSLIDEVASGFSISFDGVMSHTSQAIKERLRTESFNMVSWWAMTPQDWICPGCGRGKIDIARLNSRKEAMCHLHEHHDHMQGVLKRKFRELAVSKSAVVADQDCEDFAKRSAAMIVAYEPTVICADCNTAEGAAKRLVGTPSDFSFSPQEIREFVQPQPNMPHEINVEAAQSIWNEQKEVFDLRMEFAERIAQIAANNEHWYQPAEYRSSAKAIEQRTSVLLRKYGAESSLITELCGSPKNIQKKDPAEWRLKKQSPCTSPPNDQDLMLLKNTSASKTWSRVSDTWACEICRRSKFQTVTRNREKKWSFHPGYSYLYGKAAADVTRMICEECRHVAVMLGKEFSMKTGLDGTRFIRWIAPDELKALIIPQAHTRHNVNNDYAEKLLKTLEERLRETDLGVT